LRSGPSDSIVIHSVAIGRLEPDVIALMMYCESLWRVTLQRSFYASLVIRSPPPESSFFSCRIFNYTKTSRARIRNRGGNRFNLAGATQVYFSEPGVKGKIVRVKELPDLPDIRLGSNGTQSSVDVGPLPPRNQVTIELDIAPEASVGPVRLRVLTPLGTSPEGSFLVEPYYGESPDREPNDTLETAFETYLPTVLAGAISRPGEESSFVVPVRPEMQCTAELLRAPAATAP
jgi:hypothetical protein